MIVAEFLAEDCMMRMFEGCRNLSEIEVHFKDWAGATEDWVKDIANFGTFRCPRELTESEGPSRIPEGWKIKHQFLFFK